MKQQPKRNLKAGKWAARSFGAEWQTNPGSSRNEYLNDSAFYFGEDKEKFADLTPEEKAVCLEYFAMGVKSEKECQ